MTLAAGSVTTEQADIVTASGKLRLAATLNKGEAADTLNARIELAANATGEDLVDVKPDRTLSRYPLVFSYEIAA